jgi:hypothetical protein
MHRRLAVEQARSLGLLDPEWPGSWTHLHLTRTLYADGKVLSPLFRPHPGDTRLDKSTGELCPLRAEPDARLHFEGTSETAWGDQMGAGRSPFQRRTRTRDCRCPLGTDTQGRSSGSNGLLQRTRTALPRRTRSPLRHRATRRPTLRELGLRALFLREQKMRFNTEMRPLICQVAPSLLEVYGVGFGVAAKLLIAAGDNPHRIRSEAAWAHLCGCRNVMI